MSKFAEKPYSSTAERVILKVISAGIFFVPVIPLLFSRSLLFPFITTQGFLFRALVEILSGLWIALLVINPDFRPRKSLVLWTVFGFLVVITIADITGINFYHSFWSNYERMEGLITHLHLFVFFLIASSVLKTAPQWRKFFTVSVITSIGVAGYALLQKAGVFPLLQSSFRLEGTVGNAASLATYLLFHIFLALFLRFAGSPSKAQKRIYAAAIALHLIVLYLTGTRGAMVGLVIGLLVMGATLLIFNYQSVATRRRMLWMALGIFGIVGALSWISISLARNSRILSRFGDITSSAVFSRERLYLWQAAWEGVKARPYLGWGQESFKWVAAKYYNPPVTVGDGWFDRAHNIGLDWLVASGFLGLAAYGAIFGALLYYLIFDKRKIFSRAEQCIFSGLLGAYVIQNLSTFDTLPSYLAFFSVVSYVHARVTAAGAAARKAVEESPAPIFPVRRQAAQMALALVLLVVSLYIVSILNGRAYFANKTTAEALATGAAGLPLFEKALAYNSYGTTEVREQLAFTALKLAEDNPAAPGIWEEFLKRAIQEMENEAAKIPPRPRHAALVGNLFMVAKKPDQAVEYLKRAVELFPARQDIRINLGILYIQQKKYAEAVKIFQELYEQEVQSVRLGGAQYRLDNAMLRYAAALIYAGRVEEAERVLGDRYFVVFYADTENLLINAYAQAGHYDRVLRIWQARLQREPNNLDYRLSLMATQYRLGQKLEAIATIRKVIELSPDFKARGEFYIREIQAGRNIEGSSAYLK